MKVSVRNIINDRGNTIPNQFIIWGADGGKYFQSYESIIACKKDGVVTLDANYWDYSRTTGKYRNIFLGETKRETEAKIKSGEYKLVNLN